MGTFPRSMNFPGLHMRIGIACFVFLLARFAAAEDSLHVYYYGGEAIEQMNIGGVTVTLTLKDTGRLNQVAVYVDNRSSESVNVIPANITLHQNAPKDKGLAAKSDQEVQKIGGHSAVGQVVSEVGTGLSRAKDKLSGKEDASSGKAPPIMTRKRVGSPTPTNSLKRARRSHLGALIFAAARYSQPQSCLGSFGLIGTMRLPQTPCR